MRWTSLDGQEPPFATVRFTGGHLTAIAYYTLKAIQALARSQRSGLAAFSISRSAKAIASKRARTSLG